MPRGAPPGSTYLASKAAAAAGLPGVASAFTGAGLAGLPFAIGSMIPRKFSSETTENLPDKGRHPNARRRQSGKRGRIAAGQGIRAPQRKPIPREFATTPKNMAPRYAPQPASRPRAGTQPGQPLQAGRRPMSRGRQAAQNKQQRMTQQAAQAQALRGGRRQPMQHSV